MLKDESINLICAIKDIDVNDIRKEDCKVEINELFSLNLIRL